MKAHSVITQESLPALIEELRKAKKTIVFTNGCFDLIHIGHISYLEQAKALGDSLIVGINSDKSVRKIKGEKRPLINEAERAKIVSSLHFVDYVVVFDEETPISILDQIKPDIHVKGGDYKAEKLPEYKVVTSAGGRVVILPYISGRSTTSIIKSITDLFGAK